MSWSSDRSLTRRDFLRRAGETAAAVGAAAALGCLLEGCGTGHHHGSAATTTTTGPSRTATTAGPPDWSELASTLSGPLVLPADASYGVDKQLYNERFDGFSPAAIAYCRTPADVQRCVDFARNHGIQVAARAGGHSYGGYSLCSGLVVDVTSMAAVTVASDAQSAVVGAGARLIDVYSQLGQAGVLLPGGSCPTVGIAGLTLGGGIGVFGRNYGLTCDHLTSLDIVTADGSLVTASPGSDGDLFWACQGGGGGNFGIVTSFTFDVDPIPPIALFTLEWPWAAAADVLGSWLAWVPATPQELWSNCQLLSQGSAGPPEAKVTGVLCGSTATLATLVDRLAGMVGSPTYRFVGPEPYLKAMLIEAGCEGSTVAQCHLPAQNPAGKLSRSAFDAKSGFLSSALPDTGVAAVVAAVAALSSTVPEVGGGIVFDSYGGQIAKVGSSATAFAHRDALCGIQYSFSWGTTTSAGALAQGRTWLTDVQGKLAPYADGAYVNYIDPTLADWQQAYYGANLARLVEVKSSVDPDDFFRFAQSIPVRL